MKFIVKRTSTYSEHQPCEEAKRIKLTITETLGSDNPSDVPYYKQYPHQWSEVGKNHRVVDGRCTREVERMDWVLNFSSVAAIKEFVNKYGECVIGVDEGAGLMTIEIYDDYRE